MKRDMDLIRQILLQVEEFPEYEWVPLDKIEGADEEELSYHVQLLSEAGLIEAHNASGLNSLEWNPIALTWAGHEFLDAARDDARWNAAKSTVLSRVGNLSFDLLKEVLSQLAKGQLVG